MVRLESCSPAVLDVDATRVPKPVSRKSYVLDPCLIWISKAPVRDCDRTLGVTSWTTNGSFRSVIVGSLSVIGDVAIRRGEPAGTPVKLHETVGCMSRTGTVSRRTVARLKRSGQLLLKAVVKGISVVIPIATRTGIRTYLKVTAPNCAQSVIIKHAPCVGGRARHVMITPRRSIHGDGDLPLYIYVVRPVDAYCGGVLGTDPDIISVGEADAKPSVSLDYSRG